MIESAEEKRDMEMMGKALSLFAIKYPHYTRFWKQEDNGAVEWVLLTREDLEKYESSKTSVWVTTTRTRTCKIYKCKNCGTAQEKKWNFCPDCGAKMDEVSK